MSDCVFCKIVRGELPCDKVYEDGLILAFNDISPAAPTHILFITKEHICSAANVSADNSAVIGHIFTKIAQIAASKGLADGFRVITNSGPYANQTVPHLHFHLMGGRRLDLKLG
ncbi:MAG: histidine triad nucleotide-binding protein [Oscillospiraceae bacterium]|nr:histidine triad nucleotide-binding protein [Oscillospiraceae bacterium]